MYVDGDLPNELFKIIKETLALNPDEPRLVIIPGTFSGSRREIPGSLLVQFPTHEIDHFQAILMGILSKRWQTSDLISVMHEVQRTYPLKKKTLASQNPLFLNSINIKETLTSIPRLQKTDESSQ